MRYRLLTVITVALLLAACSNRIAKREVPSDHVVRSYRLVAEGDRLMEEGKDHLALLKYVEATELNPYHEVLFNKLAIAYSRLLQYPQAERAAQRAVRLNPKYAFAHNTLGIVRLAQQDPKGAVKAISKAIELSSTVPSFFVNLGHAQLQRHKFEEARTAYRKALELDPAVFTNKGIVEVSFTRENKPDPEVSYQLAVFFAEEGAKESCLTYLEKAFEAGFADKRRLAKETAFEKLKNDQDFVKLLDSFGMNPGPVGS